MEICDYIEFNIYGKMRRIELCLGDITDLTTKDSVDLLLVSAFPDNYAPINGTLIGALNKKFQLSVRDLARDKAEDLRKNFNCWISKELPSNIPFKRILCFEQDPKKLMKEDQSNLVGAIFRSLFTTFKDNEWSLVTPILSTGNQRANKAKMLNEMVRASSAWITAEMPLSCMKIVIFKDKRTKTLCNEDKESILLFSKLKSEINWKPYKNLISILYDVIFFYVKEDEDNVNIFLEILKGICTENPINFKLECLKKENYADYSKNYDIYEKYQKKMLESKKVGLFLSTEFLEHAEAIEVYNLALCLSQKTHKSLLTPICLKRIACVPEYMTTHQWIDCKLKSENMKLEEQLQKGANSFFQMLEDERLGLIKNEDNESSINQQEFINNNYDIFISYAHKDDIKCNDILKFLEISLPNARIFYDKHDIKIGSSWQEIIYNALSGSKIVLALISENYIQSNMCRDEYNIALSQHWSPDFDTKLFPIWISDESIQSVIPKYSKYFYKSYLMNNVFIPSFSEDASNCLSSTLQMTSLFHYILKHIIQPLLLGEQIQFVFTNENSVDLEKAAMIARKNFFKKAWNLQKDTYFIPNRKETTVKKNETNTKIKDVAIGFHADDSHHAKYIETTLHNINKDLKVIFCPMGPDKDEGKSLKDIETVHIIVILMKPFYIMTKSFRNLLNIALSLQRKNTNSGPIVLPIILESLPRKPSYFHLLSSRFNIEDEIYVQIANKMEYFPKTSYLLYDVKVSKRFAIMFTFISNWIAKGIFLNGSFDPPVTLVINSTYNLMNTDFDEPYFADIETAEKQIKLIKISEEDINMAKKFLSENSIVPLIKNIIDVDLSKTDENRCPKESIQVKLPIITKVCSIM